MNTGERSHGKECWCGGRGRWALALLSVLLAAGLRGGPARATAPAVQITCPPGQTVMAQRSTLFATVQVGMATSTTPGAMVVGVRSDGHGLDEAYPVGVTTITWQATDRAGNQATCTPTITVLPRFVVPVPFPSLVIQPDQANPAIEGLSVDQGPLQQRVIIRGQGFADIQGRSYVLFGGRQVPVFAWSRSAVTIIINPLAYGQAPLALNAAYPIQIFAPAAGKMSNTVDFFLTDAAPALYPNGPLPGPSDQPVFASFQKSLYCPGDILAIMGAGFGQTQGSGFVTITVPLVDQHGNRVMQEFAFPVLSWSENTITVALDLPAGAAPGAYTATVHRSNGKTASGTFTAARRAVETTATTAPSPPARTPESKAELARWLP